MSQLSPHNGLLVALTAKIISIYVGNHVISGADITKVIAGVHAGLRAIGIDK